MDCVDTPWNGVPTVYQPEAQRAGYLPRGSISTATGGKQVCKKSLTFVLESDDAGLGKTLLMLWIAYGLARKEDRAFFIDDTRWAYGNYTDIFLPPPLPDCAAPPAHEILPCPRQARHLVVSAETADEFFRGILKNNSQPWSDSRNHQSRKEQFDLARQGYEALFRLNSADSEYVASRLHELTSAKKLVSTIAVGIHVRRGDRHPLEFEYRRSYIPLYAYADAAGEIIMQRNRGTTPATGFLILSSDDPAVYASEELRGAIPAQDRIRLGLRETLHTADVVQRDKSVIYKFVDQDDISNDDALSPFAASRIWHGGFFSDTFWNLGLPANAHAHVHAHSYGHSHSHGYAQIPVTANGQAPAKRLPVDATRSSKDVDTIITDSTPRALHLRSIVGRAYVMDLAVLAGASDDIVCAD
ncbi:uncharacterized protein CTHT_0058110 [Thermochaetoides thermophila DSM 1495]|uniref:Uncharacterized protein n=1 Tax=Chaetomium thermophilum (strain DSM 1495 / CBS 144.50 / IMI 039719) TaxID=759272 RepID=G0SCR0_CHATD|nr:hypothetical protein CTHT_0058110 [Thermochaetoides thermophila DSM 1495]EGS19186.1 hypothetical protein CTHT_0058110 [Thermochaetoides thermophila DSM 1495]